MSDAAFLRDLRRGLSNERLARYQSPVNDSEISLLARYFMNMRFCEALYPALQTLEVTLRNSVHEVFSKTYGPDWIVSSAIQLDNFRQRDLKESNLRLREQGKEHPTTADLIGNLGFGFWTGLFSRSYEAGNTRGTPFWPRNLKQVFPNMPKKIRTRKHTESNLQQVRRLRNRVFHHEPVWAFRDLLETHRYILDCVCWMNPSMGKVLSMFDRFPVVYGEKDTFCRMQLFDLFSRQGFTEG